MLLDYSSCKRLPKKIKGNLDYCIANRSTKEKWAFIDIYTRKIERVKAKRDETIIIHPANCTKYACLCNIHRNLEIILFVEIPFKTIKKKE
jgi:hypothetical protein